MKKKKSKGRKKKVGKSKKGGKRNRENVHSIVQCITDIKRCPWCNGYRRRKWTQRHEFKSWTRDREKVKVVIKKIFKKRRVKNRRKGRE